MPEFLEGPNIDTSKLPSDKNIELLHIKLGNLSNNTN